MRLPPPQPVQRQLPKLEVDDGERWTLHVLGKGNKERSIPLPAACVMFVTAHRRLRDLPPQPPTFEPRAADPRPQGRLAAALRAVRRGEGDLCRGGRQTREDRSGRRASAALRVTALVAARIRQDARRRSSGAIAGRAGAARSRVGTDHRRLREDRPVAAACVRRRDVFGHAWR
jgi:hypothetical protein